MAISSIWPDNRLFSIPLIRLDIRQVKSGIRLDTEHRKRPDIRCIPKNYYQKILPTGIFDFILNFLIEEKGSFLA
jgi:hypothetical protein